MVLTFSPTSNETKKAVLGSNIMDNNPDARNWGDHLPDLILNKIVRRLDSVGTYVNFACVCRLWRASAKETAADFVPSQPPMLINFLQSQKDGYKVIFYGILEDKIYCKRIEGIKELRYIGESHGWLIMTRPRYDDDGFRDEFPVLLNPFTGAKIELPSIKVHKDRVKAGALSTSPTSSDCIVFLVSEHHIIHYYRTDSGSWDWRIRHQPRFSRSLRNVFFVKNRVYAATPSNLITVMEISPCGGGGCKYLFYVGPLPGGVCSRIMEAGGDMWAFRFTSVSYMESYRYDLWTEEWMEAEFGGDRLLFTCNEGSWEFYDVSKCCCCRHEICAAFNRHNMVFSKLGGGGGGRGLHELDGTSCSLLLSMMPFDRKENRLSLQGTTTTSSSTCCRNVRLKSLLITFGTAKIRGTWFSPENYI